ncbi:PepSY domain-containing protein [Mangrovivirga sp. M17]|uniref:PepSY domain-containing protein n=1 Tax=Mangrovivirga halotolerans TaxID=2993936 RepID=A0ABT3RR53_9BACT|nr:PepSY domain-containing protein [Mangrovivirga halotolerans]MCX2744106.1 PepSY domain-containing protein [Mangrovivirga halotolerans]
MRRLLGYFMIILFAGAMVACGDDEEVVGPINDQQAETKALSSLSGTSGTVTSNDVDTTATNEFYYDIDVVTTEGAVLEFEYFQEDGSLKEIEGDSGPFDYEVNPGMGLILFSVAKAAALEAITAQPGEVLRWSLEFDATADAWVYTFEVLDANSEDLTVRINAASGTVIE